MGELIRLKCEKCGRSYEIGVGHGMADKNLDAVLRNFDDPTAAHIREMLSSSESGTGWSYRKMIGYCSSCRSFFEIPTFHITNKEKEQTVAAKCRCGNNCVLFDDEDRDQMATIKCPDCNDFMTASSAGMWD